MRLGLRAPYIYTLLVKCGSLQWWLLAESPPYIGAPLNPTRARFRAPALRGVRCAAVLSHRLHVVFRLAHCPAGFGSGGCGCSGRLGDPWRYASRNAQATSRLSCREIRYSLRSWRNSRHSRRAHPCHLKPTPLEQCSRIPMLHQAMLLGLRTT